MLPVLAGRRTRALHATRTAGRSQYQVDRRDEPGAVGRASSSGGYGLMRASMVGDLGLWVLLGLMGHGF